MIKLTDSEVEMAAQVGLRRQLEALRKGLPDKHGYEGDGWGIHIEGALGELALAKFLGVYWDGSVNTFKTKGDLGETEVRTRSRSDYDLIVREDDREDAVYVLVVGKAPAYRVVGWMLGKEAKQDRWVRTYGGRTPAYFVPQAALHPFKPR
jgi:hypothetical protein